MYLLLDISIQYKENRILGITYIAFLLYFFLFSMFLIFLRLSKRKVFEQKAKCKFESHKFYKMSVCRVRPAFTSVCKGLVKYKKFKIIPIDPNVVEIFISYTGFSKLEMWKYRPKLYVCKAYYKNEH